MKTSLWISLIVLRGMAALSLSFCLRSSSTVNESAMLFDSVFAANTCNLAFSASAIRMALWFPQNSTAKPATSIIQKIAPITSRQNFFRSYRFGRNNLMKISTPSPATPTQTKTNPHSPTDSQILSDDKSRAVMHDFYKRQERLNFGTMIALAVLAVFGLIKNFIKKS